MTITCKHGSLARSCQVCDLEKEVAEQAAEIERMREALDSVATMSEEASVARYARRAVLGVKHDDR